MSRELGGRIGRGARLARLSATAGSGLLSARRRGRRGDGAGVDAAHDEIAEAVFAALGSMKGAAMKLGQMLSFVDLDLDPETTARYRRRLAALQSAAPPSDPDAVAQVLRGEYGAPADAVFAEWEPEPFAVASIGQVHRATLHDGTRVAVKVQHPGVAEAVEADLANVELLAPLVRITSPNLDARPLLAELRERVVAELDYQQEAASQQAFVDRYAGHPWVVVPRVHHDACRPRVLVSDLVEGAGLEELLASATSAERDRYGEIVFRFAFGSLYRFRLFNADPHPGNLLFPGDGTVAFLDYGSARTFTSDDRARLHAVHRAVALEDRTAFDVAIEAAGVVRPGSDVDRGVVMDWFRLAREPVAADAPYTYTADYARRVARASTDPEAGYLESLRALNMPPAYLLLNRIQWGLNSLLARIGPTANWHRVLAELAEREPPGTQLGREEAAWLAASRYRG